MQTIAYRIFEKVAVISSDVHNDARGTMAVKYDSTIDELGLDFSVKETRVYSMPECGTFFGIHYSSEDAPMTKLISVIQGRGMDYIVDLREGSPTYLKWEKVELSAENALSILVPAGFGHAFQSLEDNTIQLFMIDRSGKDGISGKINYRDESIGLILEKPVSKIAEYDLNAPMVEKTASFSSIDALMEDLNN